MLASAKQLFGGEIYEQTEQQLEQFGTIGMDQFGDFYRYGQAGASNISAGKLQLSPTPATAHHNIAATAAVALDGRTRKVTLQLGAAAAAANEYAGGYLVASDVSPEGETYRILGHPAADSAATLEVTVDRPFVSAITTSSEFCLFHHTYNGVVETATASSTRAVAGVPLIDITAAYHGWFKVRGIAAVLADETITLGAGVTPGTSTAGSVEEVDQPGDTTVLVDRQVGWAVVAGVDTEYRPIDLTII